MNRRTALAYVATMAGYLYGKPIRAEQGQAMQLLLDSVDVIVVQYRGRRVMVNPHEILDALGAPPPQFNPAQMPYGMPQAPKR